MVDKDNDEYIAKNAKPITGNEEIEAADFKNQNGFTVAMMIIGNFEDVLKQQKEGKVAMKFKSKSKIKKGDGADVVFDISGCSPNKNGFCEVFADIIGFDSNKKIYFEVKDLPLSVGSIKPIKNMFFLSEASLKFTSEEKDPLGKYQMKTHPELLLLQKTMMLVEGVGVFLDKDLNIWDLARPFVKEWATKNIGFDAKIKDFVVEMVDIFKKYKLAI